MIPFFCPTKNRASQCRLMLESINRNAPGIFRPNILWKADPKYVAGYEKLMNEQWVKDMGTVFTQETDMIKQFYQFLEDAVTIKKTHIALFMDDCIFYRSLKVDKNKLKSLFTDNTWCVSLRLGANTIIQDYITGEVQKEIGPGYSIDEFIHYEFKEHHPHKNYGFHFSWDGVIYRPQDILKIFNGADFTQTSNQWAIAPQRIENYMMNRRDEVPYSMMCCPEHSYVVCMNWNCTHPYAKTGVKFGSGMEEMQELYMQDYVIDLDSIDFNNIRSCHEELGFTYKQL